MRWHLLMGDFNAEVSEVSFSSFCELYEVKSIVNQSTCFKNPTNPSCIELSNKLTKQFPEINSSWHRLMRFSKTYCYCVHLSELLIYSPTENTLRQRQIHWWNFFQFIKAQFARINTGNFHKHIYLKYLRFRNHI